MTDIICWHSYLDMDKSKNVTNVTCRSNSVGIVQGHWYGRKQGNKVLGMTVQYTTQPYLTWHVVHLWWNRYCIAGKVVFKFCDFGQNAVWLNSVNFKFGDLFCQSNNDINHYNVSHMIACYLAALARRFPWRTFPSLSSPPVCTHHTSLTFEVKPTWNMLGYGLLPL